jgi:hypothetical protein
MKKKDDEDEDDSEEEPRSANRRTTGRQSVVNQPLYNPERVFTPAPPTLKMLVYINCS